MDRVKSLSSSAHHKVELSDIVLDSMTEYAREIIRYRAIPELLDGNKPVHRRIMYQMQSEGNTHKSKHVKVSQIVGATMGRFHPHGDGSIEDALTNLAQPWSVRMPLIEIHGNYGGTGSQDSAAAGRYIEARLSKAASLLMDGIDENAIDMVPNYDNSTNEPVVLPSRVPMSLINGTTGIAIGVATSMLPHNPLEIIEMMRLAVKDNLTPETAKTVFNGPDFPTGNEIIEGDLLQELYSPKASFKIRAKTRIVGNAIIVDEMPFEGPTDKLIESLARVGSTIPEVKTIRDETQFFPDIRIVIECNKNTSTDRMEEIRAQLEVKSDLSKNVSANNLVISNGRPQYLTLIDHIKEFVKFRKETLIRVWSYRLDNHQKRLLILESEKAVIDDLETLKMLLEESEDRQSLIKELIRAFDFTVDQASHIASMSVSSLLKNDKTRAIELDSQIKKVSAKIRELEHSLGSGMSRALLADLDETERIVIDTGLHRRRTITGSAREFNRKIAKKARVAAISKTPLTVCASKVSPVISTGSMDASFSLKVPGDHVIAAITRSGKAVIRYASEFSKDERTNRTVEGISTDDVFIGLIDLSVDSHIITLSKMGYMKKIHSQALIPNMNTKRYLKRSHIVSGVKGGEDALVYADSFELEELSSLGLKITLKRTRKPEVIVELEKLLSFEDRGTGNGRRFLNSHNGLDIITSIERKIIA